MFKNWRYQLLALILALVFWYIITGREKVETWVLIPLESTGVPEDIILKKELPVNIRVRIRGTRPLVDALSENLPTYTLDISHIERGENMVIFDPDNLSLSTGLQVTEFSPTRVTVIADLKTSKTLPIQPFWEGGPGENFILKETTVTPRVAVITGPDDLLAQMESINTLLRRVEGKRPGLYKFTTDLALPEGMTANVKNVEVTLSYEPKKKKLWLKLPIKANNDGEPGLITPGEVQIHVNMPLYLLEQENFRNYFTAIVDVSAGAGVHILPITVKVPKYTELLKTVPEKAQVAIKKENIPVGSFSGSSDGATDE